ncbi:universal stress protein [Haloarcula litorea]|uniref:universal stress protein n=1 Tax=Haloarcula litorea TaxID=3032579 RepID=UPI0023E7FF54|nr:universal stress protein [Halomicroarcula sp. GDY20]
MYDTILLPTDGSDGMDTVTEHGLTLADRFDAEIHVLHVVDDRAYASVPDDARDRIRETLEADAEDATKAVAERSLEAEIPVVREIRWGNPPASIIAYTRENEVDLIVMGTHGRSGYERYLLGSVAEKVVRAASVPVLTVNIFDQPAETGEESGVAAPETDLR